LCKTYGVKLIEDAAHAFGGRHPSRSYVGACDYSDLTVFSFHAVKSITTGEGGAVTTNDSSLADNLRKLRSHGVTKDRASFRSEDAGGWYYEQQNLGYNYRMTDIQAALGSSQLKRVDKFIDSRRSAADYYRTIFADVPVKLPPADSNCAWHLFRVGVLGENTKSRKMVFDFLRKRNVGVNVHYIPIHTQPYYQMLGFEKGKFPKAEKFYDESISIPLFPGISTEQQLYVKDVFVDALRELGQL